MRTLLFFVVDMGSCDLYAGRKYSQFADVRDADRVPQSLITTGPDGDKALLSYPDSRARVLTAVMVHAVSACKVVDVVTKMCLPLRDAVQ